MNSPGLTAMTMSRSCGTRFNPVMLRQINAQANSTCQIGSRPKRGLSSFRSSFVVFPDKENNFKIRDDTVSSALGVPYDYGSVMHYSKTAFSTGSAPTIITKIPQFLDVIGQRMGFSAGDLSKLNRLYNCSQSPTLWIPNDLK